MHTEISARQHLIMEYIRENGSVQVDQLAKHLQVTPQTIRRDLNQLYDLKFVQRVRGGAVIKNTVENLGHGARKILMADEKTAIARSASEIIEDNSSMFINLGTTTERVAEFLIEHRSILVITNNINVASILWPNRTIQVMIAGGMIRTSDGGIVGPSTEEFIDRFKPDYAIIGCSAIDGTGEILDYDLREVRVTQAIVRQARSVILVTDSMKLDRTAPVKVGTLADIDILVTDEGISNDFVEVCRQNEVDVKIAKSER
ncbi:MAG: DeoR/GlpR transcriptional regulator [Desulfobulbaceae bacterium]|nr:MAG: DeoR/GlpR transcriptional regulator [Desulfobulbaceae bacterium]